MHIRGIEMEGRARVKIMVASVGSTIEERILRCICKGLEATIPNCICEASSSPIPIPSETYNPIRRQYHSTPILEALRAQSRRFNADRVLGVTNLDLYVPNLNFVFGEASLSGKVAIISLWRLRPEFYGQSPNSKLFMERTLKEAIHEIGHTLWLRHCSNPRCVMYFSNSIIDTDFKSSSFCPSCLEELKAKLRL